MSKQVAKTETPQLPAHAQAQGFEQASASSILIPKIYLMQAMSQLVQDNEARPGDIVNNITKQVVGSKDKALDFIPLTFFESWHLMEQIGQKFEYRGQEPRNPGNDNLPWEFQKDGTNWKRVKALNVYALLSEQVKAESDDIARAMKDGTMPDPTKGLLPVLICFRSTSLKAGNVVATHFEVVRGYQERGFKNVQAFQSSFKLHCHKTTNDLGTFYVFDVSPGGATPKEYLEAATHWRAKILGGQTTVKEEEDAEPAQGESRF